MRPRAYGSKGDAALAAVVYAASAVGMSLYVASAVDAEAAARAPARALFLIVPAALFAVFLGLAWRSLRELRAGAWGARTRAYVLALFLASGFMAALPPALGLGAAATRAARAPAGRAVAAGLDAGVERLLSYYADKERELRFAATRDLPSLLAAQGPNAKACLEAMSARYPELVALELFAGGRSIGFAGEPGLRSAGDAPPERPGPLPRLSTGGVSYLRYFAAELGSAPDGRDAAAVLALRLDEGAERAAAAFQTARAALPEAAGAAAALPPALGMFGAALVLAMLGLAGTFSVLAADALMQPLEALREAVGRLRGDRGRAAYLSKAGDESGRLIDELNAALDRLERARGDRLRSEKLTLWRDMARQLAHELRNPLTPIRLSAERVLKRFQADPDSVGDILPRSMGAIIAETRHMEELLGEFRDFSRLPEPRLRTVELRPLALELVHLYSASWPRLTVDCGGIADGLTLRADPGHLKQLLGNLLTNAAEATDGAGSVAIRAELVKTGDSHYCRLVVEDDGPGVAADEAGRVFSPYYTTKPTGTGLGLAVVDHIASAHGGSVRLESEPGRGAAFIVDLPLERGLPGAGADGRDEPGEP
mgnify:CR=1 FL=1